jgi:hypothetical protein
MSHRLLYKYNGQNRPILIEKQENIIIKKDLGYLIEKIMAVDLSSIPKPKTNTNNVIHNWDWNADSVCKDWNIMTTNSIFVAKYTNKKITRTVDFLSKVEKYIMKLGILFLSIAVTYPNRGTSRLYFDDFDEERIRSNKFTDDEQPILKKKWKDLWHNIPGYYKTYPNNELYTDIFQKFAYICSCVQVIMDKDLMENDMEYLQVFWLLCASMTPDNEFSERRLKEFQYYNFNMHNIEDEKIRKLYIVSNEDSYLHTKNNYFGQTFRISATRDTSIRNKTLILQRDAHATCPTIYEKNLLKKFIVSEKQFLIGHSDTYRTPWHKRGMNGYNKGVWMGFTTFKKDNNQLALSDEKWWGSWGKIFTIVSNKNDLYIKAAHERVHNYVFGLMNKYNNLGGTSIKDDPFIYGMDEFLATNLLYNNNGEVSEDLDEDVEPDSSQEKLYSIQFQNSLIRNVHKNTYWINISLFLYSIKSLYNLYPFMSYGIKYMYAKYYDILKDLSAGEFFYVMTFLEKKMGEMPNMIRHNYNAIMVAKVLQTLPKIENIMHLLCLNWGIGGAMTTKLMHMYEDINRSNAERVKFTNYFEGDNMKSCIKYHKITFSSNTHKLVYARGEPEISCGDSLIGYKWSNRIMTDNENFAFLKKIYSAFSDNDIPQKGGETREAIDAEHEDVARYYQQKNEDKEAEPKKIEETKEVEPKKIEESKEAEPKKIEETREVEPKKIEETKEVEPKKIEETREVEPKTSQVKCNVKGIDINTLQCSPKNEFRKAQLKLHPDKNIDCADEAAFKFKQYMEKCSKSDVSITSSAQSGVLLLTDNDSSNKQNFIKLLTDKYGNKNTKKRDMGKLINNIIDKNPNMLPHEIHNKISEQYSNNDEQYSNNDGQKKDNHNQHSNYDAQQSNTCHHGQYINCPYCTPSIPMSIIPMQMINQQPCVTGNVCTIRSQSCNNSRMYDSMTNGRVKFYRVKYELCIKLIGLHLLHNLDLDVYSSLNIKTICTNVFKIKNEIFISELTKILGNQVKMMSSINIIRQIYTNTTFENVTINQLDHLINNLKSVQLLDSMDVVIYLKNLMIKNVVLSVDIDHTIGFLIRNILNDAVVLNSVLKVLLEYYITKDNLIPIKYKNITINSLYDMIKNIPLMDPLEMLYDNINETGINNVHELYNILQSVPSSSIMPDNDDEKNVKIFSAKELSVTIVDRLIKAMENKPINQYKQTKQEKHYESYMKYKRLYKELKKQRSIQN